MSILSRLFGGKSQTSKDAEAEHYEGFRIVPTPINEGSIYRVSARIEKDFGDQTKTHELIRADTMQSLEDALAASVRKAKQVIDEQGDRLFG
jgi:hypothetical protein